MTKQDGLGVFHREEEDSKVLQQGSCRINFLAKDHLRDVLQ